MVAASQWIKGKPTEEAVSIKNRSASSTLNLKYSGRAFTADEYFLLVPQ
jgi:hypothetical protein